MTRRMVQGNQACFEGAIAAGCTFFGGYPITPSSEIAERMASRLPEIGGVFVQMEDEIASLAAVIGASLGGSRAMTATSGPGFSLMQEHIGYATMAEIPCVIINVMRGGPSTGMPTSPSQGDVMQARWGTHGDRQAVVLAPASVREVFDHTVRAFELSERLRTPVVVLYDEVIGHLREGVDLPAEPVLAPRMIPEADPADYLPYAAGDGDVPAFAPFGIGYRYHVTGLTHDARGFPTTDPTVGGDLISRLDRKITDHLDDIAAAEEYLCDDADVVVFAYGIVARAAREAVDRLRAEGYRVGMFRPITLWPLPEKRLALAADAARRVVVAEMNRGQMLHEVERVVGGSVPVTPLLRADGRPITPIQVTEVLEGLRTEVAL